MQDIIAKEIINAPTPLDTDIVSQKGKPLDMDDRMEIDFNVTINQQKKQTEINKTEKFVIAEAETDPSNDKIRTTETIKTRSPIHENNINKIPETIEDIEKQKTSQHLNSETEKNPAQSKYPTAFRGRMRPDPSIQHHPAYPLLFEYATEGCPVDCGVSWTREHLEAAIARGPHISAKEPEAAAALRREALEKVAQGEAEILRWEDIKDSPHKNLKISPLAAVPHKSRLFRAILDLSFQLRLRGIKLPSVNAETVPLSDHKAMEQMGKALWRLVNAVAKSKNEHGPIVFAKWDIKDGFWRLVVSEEDSWNFCYVLPRVNEEDPIEIVRPTCLQMGWCESPPLFCTASETARDIAQEQADNTELLEPHPLENLCLPNNFECLPSIRQSDQESMIKLLEVYMDDFIGLAQAITKEELLHFTRAVLHGIHTVFPPPGEGDDPEDEPISLKKLKQGDGRWDTQKEILGWLFDGLTKCMQLPPAKVLKIRKNIFQITNKKMVRIGELEQLNGKLMHASMGIPNG